MNGMHILTMLEGYEMNISLSSKEVSDVLLKHIKTTLKREDIKVIHEPTGDISFKIVEIVPSINMLEMKIR